MSTTIDQRVVEMRFDNKQFESGVSTTMSTLDKLKKSLNLSGAAKGLDEVSTAAKNCDVSVVGTAAEKVGLKFSAMFSIADQVLRNITNSAMAAGKRIISALTIDPVKTGFKEYETQIKAIQTILANTESKGTTLEDVNGALDELNTYADKTIYNFTEMTRNIGTFTAAGVDLDTSVSAIKGIANLAAVSGSTSQQASTAMYQLSQAMASGTVKLMDWNSVVNAGMGGQVFQDALKETAKVHGIAIDDIIKKNGSFRESLSEGWLTTEILTDTLAKFTGDLSEEQLKSQGYTEKQIEEIMKLGQTANDAATKVKTFSQLFETLQEAAQSGWTQTWEILIGDFEEAKELLTNISDVVGGFINNMSESRNEMLENWKVMGGRQDLLDSFKNIFEGLVSVITPIRDAFREIFPPMTAEQLVKITAGFKEFTAKLKLSDEGADNLKRTLKGIFSVFKIVGNIVLAVFKAIGKLFTGVGHLGGGLLSVTAVAGNFLAYFSELIDHGSIFEKVFNGVAAVINFVAKVIATLVKGFGVLFEFVGHGLVFPGINSLVAGLKSVFDSFICTGGAASEFKEKVTGAFANAGEALRNNPLLTVITKVWEVVKTVGTAIYKFFTKVFGGLIDKLAEGDLIGILDVVNTFISGGVGIAIIKFLKGLKDSFGDFAGLGESIGGVLDSFSGSLNAFQNSLNATALKQIATAIAILAAGILVLSFVDKDKLTDSLSAIVVLFAGLMGTMAVAVKGGGIRQMAGISTAMVALSIGVLILASALKKISSLDTDEIIRGLLGLVGIMGAMALVMMAMKTTDSYFDNATNAGGFWDRTTKESKTVIKGAMQMIGIAIAAKILASVLADIAYLEWDELGRGIVGLTAVMALLVGAMKILPLGTKNIGKPFWKFCAQMILVTKAAKMLAESLVMLSDLEWDELGRGVVGLTTVMTLLVASMKILAKSQDIAKTTQKTSFKSTTNFLGMATMVAAMAVAIRLLVPAIREIGEMEWGDLGKFGAVLTGLTAAIILITSLEDVITHKARKASFTSTEIKRDLGGLAVVMLALAVTIRIMTPAMKEIASISWPDLGKFGAVLTGVTGVVLLMSLMQNTLKTTKTTSFSKTTDFTGMATALAVLAVSLRLLVPAIREIGEMEWGNLGKAGAVLAALVAALSILGMLTTIPTFNATGIVVMCASLSILAATLGLLIVPLLALELVSWGSIIKGFIVLAGGLAALGFAATYFAFVVPLMLTVAGAFALAGIGMLAFGTGLASLSGGLTVLAAAMTVGITAMMASLVLLIKGLLDVADVIIVEVFDLVTKTTVAFCKACIEAIPVVCEALKVVVTELCALILELAPVLTDTAAELLVSVLESLDSVLPKLIDILLDILIKIVDGVAERAPELVTSLVNLFAKVFDALGKALSGFNGSALLKSVIAFYVIHSMIDSLAKIKIKDIGKAIAGLGGVSLLVLEIIAVMSAIGLLFGSEGFQSVISSGGDLLGKLSIALLKALPAIAVAVVLSSVCSAIPKGYLVSAAGVIAEVAVIVAELGALIAVFGIVASIPGAIDIVRKGGEILGAIAGAIGQIIGGFAGGLVGGALGSLLNLSVGLTALGIGIRLFFEEIKSVSAGQLQEAAKGAIYIAAAVAAMTIASKLFRILGGGSEALADILIATGVLGAAIGLFSLEVSNVNASACEAASKASLWIAVAVAAMTAAGLLGGLANMVVGPVGLVAYAASVLTIGAALAAFSWEVKDVKPEVVEAAAKAANHLSLAVIAMSGASLISAIGTLAGLGDLTYLAAVATIGKSIKVFSEQVSGVNPEVITAAASAANDLSKAVCTMSGASLLSLLDGIFCLGDLTYLAAVNTIGLAMQNFAEKVSNIDNPEAITAAASAANDLSSAVCAMAGAGILTAITNIVGIGGYFAGVATVGGALGMFAEQVKDVDPTIIEPATKAAEHLTGAVALMGATGLINAVLGICGIGDLLYLAGVGTVGTALKNFNELVKDVKPDVIKAGAEAAGPLTGAVALMGATGIINAVLGILGIGDLLYLAGVGTIGSALKDFGEKVKDVNPEIIKAASFAANWLSLAVTTMAGASLLNAVVGINVIGNLLYLAAVCILGDAIESFHKSVMNVDPSKVENAAKAANWLSLAVTTMAGASLLNAIGGILGIGDLLYWGAVGILGSSIKSFYEAVSADGGIEPDVVKAAAEAAVHLSSAVTTMSGAGFVSALSKLATLGLGDLAFSDAVKDIAKAIKKFSDEISKDGGIDPAQVSAAAGAAKDLADAVMVLPSDTSNVISFGENIVTFGDKLAAYFGKTAGITEESINSSTNALNAVKNITTIDTAKIDSVSTSIDKVTKSITDLSKVPGDSLSEFKTSLEDLGKTSIDSFVESFDGMSKKLKAKADEARKAFVKEFEKIEDDMNDVGEDSITEFKKGADGRKDKAISKFKKIADKCADAISDKAKSFWNAGKSIVQGLADGISENSYIAEAKAKAMAEAAYEAAKEALDINSPSKVFRALGYSIPEGLADGIDKLSGMASASAKDMANDSINGVKRTIANLASIITSDIDAQPTIRPVLDLSDVKSGANTIGKMFGSGASVGVMANVGAINSAMRQRNQNGTNNDVVAEISKLRKDFADGDFASYNINGITITGDDEVEAAFKTILRAAKMDRRM